ncbi:hypothetical protein [Leuconostoc gasicomitatum]|uniref:Uncharacterized protein n=1 Tax=Leuconostoc gasicomitatum TaxID=115778 RepID=A0A9Q3SXZ4_9LACO|nr:hypothetical protein [Leuconostoc gasicomitatum]MBZ5962662.1 hypothetical protein [Leuconostoc gasicomitatum]
MTEKVTVFHVGKKNNVELFVTNNELFISLQDGKWFGDGMYFWDNKSNCSFWIKDRKYSEGEYAVVQSSLQYDSEDILDFTDNEAVKNFDQMQNLVALALKLSPDESEKMKTELGFAINRCFKYQGMMKKELPSIVKGTGHYPRTPKVSERIKSQFVSTYGNKVHAAPTIDVKMIYCVKNNKVISCEDTAIIEL